MARARPTRCSAARCAGVPRSDYALVGAIGHDFYTGEREGAKGFPRFTDPRLRGPEDYADYVRMATERSLERCGVDAFDLLLLHNPDRTGYTSEAVWDALEAVRADGPDADARRRPRPRQRLHARRDRLPGALRRPDRLGDGDPQPARAVAGRAGPARRRAPRREADHPRRRLRRAVPRRRAARARRSRATTTAGSGPAGWVEAGRAKLEAMRPIAERHGLTMLQLACHWNLAHGPVAVRRADADRGAGERQVDRGQARRAGRRRAAERAQRGRGRRDPRDRRQHAARCAQGRGAGLRGRAAARSLADHAGADRARGPLGHRAWPGPDARRLKHRRPRVDHPGQDDPPPAHRRRRVRARHCWRCRRSRVPHSRPEPADAPRHAQPAAGRQPRRGRHDRPGPGRRRRRPAHHVVRRRDRRRQHREGHAGRQGAVQARLRLRRRPPGPLRRLEGRAAGQRRDRPALPVRPGRRHQGHALRHGHALRPAVRRHPGRPAARARAPPTPTTSARSPPPCSARSAPRAARATRS